MPELVAVILTKNEARHVQGCIESLRSWVDLVIVWDSGSADDTHALARAVGAHVVVRPFDNFAAQRQSVLDTISADWLLFVDADERATPALATEIRSIIDASDKPDSAVGYWIPRRNFIVGREMRTGGFYPDYQLRLLSPASARYVAEREVHEIAELTGAAGYLQEPLIHYNYESWSQFYAKQRFYALYEARILSQRGIRPRFHNFILQPIRTFYRRYVTLGGWRDGIRGLQLALLLAWYYGFIPYSFLLTGRVK